MPQTPLSMENKKSIPATQQPVTQQQLLLAHHVHPSDQIYAQQHPQITTQITSPQPQLQPNGVMHQLLQSQYQSNMDARSPLLENRHELYGTGHNHEYSRNYGANDNYNYIQSPQRSDLQPDANVNHNLLQNMPKGFNAEVYKDYLKRNPPKDANQIYQNHQPTYRPNQNQYGSKPYLPYSSRITSQSNTDLLRQQYNQIQQMKLQQQMHFQNQAQMHQQQTFAERQILLQQIHGIQPPPNLQNSLYSDGSYRDLDRYGSRNDFKDQLSSPDIQKEVDRFIKNNEFKEMEKQNRQYQESQYQTNQQLDYRDADRYRNKVDKDLSKSPEFSNHNLQKNNVGIVSPMKSSESSSPSVKSPLSESRRSSGGQQALRSPVAQRIPSAPVTVSGILHKQGSDGLKVWRKRWFVLSEYCLFYYKSQDEEKLLGSVLLPSYRVSACTAEDKVMRKFAFKLEHANMRTYILAAQDQEAMLKWVKALTMAALMQSPHEQRQKPERTPAKTENDDDVPGPTYANAPPKPRRSNEGYNSPSPEMYDPNYDLLKKPASHYSQGTSNTRYHEHTYQTSPNTDTVYTRHPQSPPQQQPYQTKRPYDTHNLSLPLTNTITDRLENTPSNPMYRTNPQSPYFDNRNRNSQQPPQKVQEHKVQDSIYERRSAQLNPFLQDSPSDAMEISPPKDTTPVNRHNVNINQHERTTLPNIQNINLNSNIEGNYSTHSELNARQSRNVASNERLLIERRTPDAYGRSMAGQERSKVGDYEDVYASYDAENEYGRPYSKAMSPPQTHESPGNYNPVQSFSGPAILRRKKMQSSGIQPPVPRPHSADFLEYESRKELNKTLPSRNVCDVPRQPQRPKSSLDINSYYDPSSDRYYSEESYAQKMRQSAQYLQHGKMGPKNIQIPLEKYASGLAEKQLHSPYGHSANNNYEIEFSLKRNNRDNMSYNSKYSEGDGISSNWTLREKDLNNQRDYSNRSVSVMSDSSNISGFVKDARKFDPTTPEGFMRSASARLPSTGLEKEGEKKVQQREESMKRLLEWKQRMLQSPLTRKSTPATISLARSLNQSRQSVRSADHFKTKNFANTYNSYSSDDEASLSMPGHLDSNTNNVANQQALSKKAFLGSNTSIGRGNRDVNIPVRAVSPRVRWVEEKPSNDNFGSQQFSTSQQNIHNLSVADDPRMIIRSPSRTSQQPIKAVSPRVRMAMENDDLTGGNNRTGQNLNVAEVPTAGELLGRTHEELVLLLIQLRRRHAATLRAMDQCCAQISSIEESLASLKTIEREDNIRRLEHLKMQLMELEHHYQKSKPLVQLVDNMVKLGSLYNRPGSTVERLERNQRLRQKVLAEHAIEQQRWLENAAAGKPLETEAARSRVAELWALEQELADEATLLQGMKTDKDAIESLLTGVRTKFGSMQMEAGGRGEQDLEAELARVHAMLALNSKKLEQTVADNARLERELIQLRRALHNQRQSPAPAHAPSAATALLEDEVSRVQQLVTALQRQRQELSRAVRHLTQQSRVLQVTQNNSPGSKQRPNHSSWQETNLDTGHTTDHDQVAYDYEVTSPGIRTREYDSQLNTPLYVDTRESGVSDMSIMSPMTSEDMHSSALGNLSNVEKQEIKTVRIVKRESERRQRDRERSLQPMTDWSNTNMTSNIDQFLEEELVVPTNNHNRSTSLPRTDFSKFEEYYSKPINDSNYPRPQDPEATNYGQTNIETGYASKYGPYDNNLYSEDINVHGYEQSGEGIYEGNEIQKYSNKNIDAYALTSTKYDEIPNHIQSGMETSSKFVSSPSLSNYDFSRDISSLSSSYNKSYDRSGYDRTISISTQYLNSPTDSARTLTNDPLSKTSSIGSLTRSHVELSPIFKSEAAKQIITEMSGDVKSGSLHRRQVPKEKRRHYTAPHHLSAKTLNELPKDGYNQDKMGRSLDDADMERVLRAPPDVVRSAIAPQRYAENTIDQLLAAPQKIVIPERYIPEKPPELSPEEQQKRQEKVESIKKMLSSSSADPSKSPDGEEKRQREHLLQMNQILAKQVMEMSKIVAGTNPESGPSTAQN